MTDLVDYEKLVQESRPTAGCNELGYEGWHLGANDGPRNRTLGWATVKMESCAGLTTGPSIRILWRYSRNSRFSRRLDPWDWWYRAPLFFDEMGDILHQPWLVLEYTEGEMDFQLRDSDSSSRQMAQQLANIHDAEWSGAGPSFLPLVDLCAVGLTQLPSGMFAALRLLRMAGPNLAEWATFSAALWSA